MCAPCAQVLGLIPSTTRKDSGADAKKSIRITNCSNDSSVAAGPPTFLQTHTPVILALLPKHGITYICRRKLVFAYKQIMLYHREQTVVLNVIW